MEWITNVSDLNESALGLVENNDPSVSGLIISKSNWIKRAGQAIGDSKSLRLLKITILSGENDGTWLGELLQYLPHNRSIELLNVYVEPIVVGEQLSSHIYELEWDIFHMLTPFIEHNSNLRNIVIRGGTPSMLSSLALALSNCKNKRLERIKLRDNLAEDDYNQIFASLAEYNNLLEVCVKNSKIGTQGCMKLSKLLQNPASRIHNLDLIDTALDDKSMGILSIGLMRSKSLKSLELDGNENATSSGWGVLSAILFHPICTIEDLRLTGVDLDDEGVTYLGGALAVNKSIQYLGLTSNHYITNEGWREFLKCMRNPDSSLKELDLCWCSIDDEGIAIIMNSLDENVSLKTLVMEYNDVTASGLITVFDSLSDCEISVEEMDLYGNDLIDFEELTEEDWHVLSCALCDKSSIYSICASNHTLATIWLPSYGFDDITQAIWSGIKSLLSMNENLNKAEVARQKILEYHSSDEHAGMSVFAGMSDTVLPNVLEWIGRSRDIRTFSIMFNVVQGIPTLFDITNDPIIEGAKKRKLSAYPIQHDK